MSFRTERHQKLIAGISIGSENITAGTLTGAFQDLTDGQTVIVSNRHVFEGDPNKTRILQPGPYDGGRSPDDQVGILKRKIDWDKSKPLPWWKRIICALFGWFLEEWCISEKIPNHLDGAVATFSPTDATRVLQPVVYLDDQTVLSIKTTHPGDDIAGRYVWKSGRTTGVTIGIVRDDKASVKVWYGDVWRVYEDVVIVQGLARGGDSGSPVFLMEGDKPSARDMHVGILFAGSDVSYVFCKYKYLETELKVRWQY
jgi:hypothetical protein